MRWERALCLSLTLNVKKCGFVRAYRQIVKSSPVSQSSVGRRWKPLHNRSNGVATKKRGAGSTTDLPLEVA